MALDNEEEIFGSDVDELAESAPQPSDDIDSPPEPKQTASAADGTADAEADPPPSPTPQTTATDLTGITFPVVGLGASAGGLEALGEFFRAMPADSGLAFVVIVHLAPNFNSQLPRLLQNYTKMLVRAIQDDQPVEPNCVYTIVPDRNVALINGRFQLMAVEKPRSVPAPIDYFFRQLAHDQRDQCVGIILSGTGSNGSIGLKAIKEVGGLVIAQEPTSAKFNGMPRSAIATDLVDYVLLPEQMPDHLLFYMNNFRAKATAAVAPRTTIENSLLQQIFVILRDQTGHDFSHYKESTIRRRLERRMTLHKIDRTIDYVRFLGQNRTEVEALFREVLIGVTNFFRDAEAFEALQKNILPIINANRINSRPVRIWVAGSSTGEEAYSLAILWKEFMNQHSYNFPVQVFATDIDSEAIDAARWGAYATGIAVDVSPDRLNRFFMKEEAAYRISREIREMVIFAVQSVIKDPPFSKLDMISCRNLLIYLDEPMQQQVLRLFHYSLKPGGFLFLGSSETRGKAEELFEPVDKKWKIFRRIGVDSARQNLTAFPQVASVGSAAVPSAAHPTLAPSTTGIGRALVEKKLLDNYTPAAALVDEHGEIAFLHGQTDPYLKPPQGESPFNILPMAREGLRQDLSLAMRKAARHKEPVVCEDLLVQKNGGQIRVRLTVEPVFEAGSGSQSWTGWLLVVLESRPNPPVPLPKAAGEDGAAPVPSPLEQELEATRERLQTTIEELEASNEDVRSANEELQAANEELQSINEELETSQEELQSANEELVTINVEFQNQITELTQRNNDIHNLLTGTEIATIFLDLELKIKLYTNHINKIISLIPSDVGRPLADLDNKLQYDRLLQDIEQVLQSLQITEIEVQDKEDNWYNLRILPYRTTNNAIDGVVLTFININGQKEKERQEQRLRYMEQIVGTLPIPLLVLDHRLSVFVANQAFYEQFQLARDEVEDRLFYEVADGAWYNEKMRTLLEQIIPSNNRIEDFAVEAVFADGQQWSMTINARRLIHADEGVELILLFIENVRQMNEAGLEKWPEVAANQPEEDTS